MFGSPWQIIIGLDIPLIYITVIGLRWWWYSGWLSGVRG